MNESAGKVKHLASLSHTTMLTRVMKGAAPTGTSHQNLDSNSTSHGTCRAQSVLFSTGPPSNLWPRLLKCWCCCFACSVITSVYLSCGCVDLQLIRAVAANYPAHLQFGAVFEPLDATSTAFSHLINPSLLEEIKHSTQQPIAHGRR